MRNPRSCPAVLAGIIASVSYEGTAIAVQPEWPSRRLSNGTALSEALSGDRPNIIHTEALSDEDLLHRELRMLTVPQQTLLEHIGTGEATKHDVEVVLARFGEDIAWSDMYKPVRTVYCKGAASTLTPECIPLPNKGRESHTYLYHVATKYDSLADWTVFSQAEAPTLGPDGHMVDGVTFHDYVLGDGPFHGDSGARFIFDGALKTARGGLFRRLSKGYAPALRQSGARVRDPCLLTEVNEAPEHSIKDFQTFLADGCFDGNLTKVTSSLRDYVQWELGMHPDRTIFFSEGARFAVSRDRIHQRPRAFYQRLLDLVGSSSSSCTGFFNEWLWYYIMGMPDDSPC